MIQTIVKHSNEMVAVAATGLYVAMDFVQTTAADCSWERMVILLFIGINLPMPDYRKWINRIAKATETKEDDE